MTEINSEMKNSFALKKSNYIFLFTYILIAFTVFFLLQDFSGPALGRTLGKMLGTMLISTIVGYICWLFSFKNNVIGEWGFNLMVFYIITILITSSYKFYQIKTAAQEMQNAEGDFDAVMKQSDSSAAEVNYAYNQFKDSIFTNLAKQAKNTTGKNKQIILIQEAYLREIEPVITHWQNNLARFMEKDVLDPSMLKIDPIVYQNRLQTIATMLSSTIEYKDMMMKMEDTIRERLLPVNLPQKQTNQIVKEFMHSPSFTLEQLEMTFDALIAYLDQSRKVLNMLNNNQDYWFVEGSEIIIEDDVFLMNYNWAIDDLWQKEARMQELFEEVFL